MKAGVGIPQSPVPQMAAWGMGDWGIQARIEEARRFVATLFAFASPESYVELRLLVGRTPSARKWFQLTEAEAALRWAVDRSSSGADVYVGVQPRARIGGGSAVDVHSIVAVAADLDCGEGKALPSKERAKQRLASLAGAGWPASLVVDSGGGLHAYWRLSEANDSAEKDLVESIGRGLARRLDSDPSVADVARVLRLPGTLNWKLKAPRPVRLLRCRATRFHLMDLEDCFASTATEENADACTVATTLHGRAARQVGSRLAATLERMGLDIRAKDGASGSVLVIESPCPLCPGQPIQQTPPRPGSAHVTPSGRLKCKRAMCPAGPVSAPFGIPFDEWAANLDHGAESAVTVVRPRAPRAPLRGLPPPVRRLRPSVGR